MTLGRVESAREGDSVGVAIDDQRMAARDWHEAIRCEGADRPAMIGQVNLACILTESSLMRCERRTQCPTDALRQHGVGRVRARDHASHDRLEHEQIGGRNGDPSTSSDFAAKEQILHSLPPSRSTLLRSIIDPAQTSAHWAKN